MILPLKLRLSRLSNEQGLTFVDTLIGLGVVAILGITIPLLSLHIDKNSRKVENYLIEQTTIISHVQELYGIDWSTLPPEQKISDSSITCFYLQGITMYNTQFLEIKCHGEQRKEFSFILEKRL